VTPASTTTERFATSKSRMALNFDILNITPVVPADGGIDPATNPVFPP